MANNTPETESVGDPIVFTTKVEKEALWDAVVQVLMANRIIYLAHGDIAPDSSLAIGANILRSKALQLSTDLGKQLSPEEALYLGLTSLIPEQILKKWSEATDYPINEKDFYRIARYLYQESIDKDSPQS